VLAAAVEQHMVEPHRTELVDHDRRIRERVLPQEPGQQRRLAAAEKTRQQMHGQRRRRGGHPVGQPSETAAIGARAGNPDRYVSTSAVGITSTYLLLRSNRLIAWLASK